MVQRLTNMLRIGQLQKLYQKHPALFRKAIIVASILLLLAVSAYSAVQGSRVLNFTSDSFVSTFMASDWRPGGTINLVSQHTNLMKFPLLWLQGYLGYNTFSYLSLNIVLLSVMMLGWSVLLWYIFGKSKRIFVASNLMLSGIMLGSTSLIISSVSTTTRNIEYPIALLYILLLNKTLKTGSRTSWIIAFIILALLVCSDFLFLYSLVPGLVLLAIWLLWDGRLSKGQTWRLLLNVVGGTLAGLAFLKLLTFLHVITLDGRHAGSFIPFDLLPSSIYNSIGQTFQLFGGNFFGSPIKLSYGGMLLSFVFAIICFVSTYRLGKRLSTESRRKSLSTANFTGFVMIACAILLYAFYILLGQANTGAGDNSRYLSLLPFIGIFAVAAQSNYWRRSYTLVLVSLLILAGGFMNSYHNYFSYQSSSRFASQQVGYDKSIINYAQENNIQLVLGSYDYGPALRFYAQSKIESHAMLVCNNTFYFFSYEGWYTPQSNVKRSAIIIDKYFAEAGKQNTYNSTNACTDAQLEKVYGPPAQKIHIAEHGDKPVYLFVYNYDIRTKLQHNRIIYL